MSFLRPVFTNQFFTPFYDPAPPAPPAGQRPPVHFSDTKYARMTIAAFMATPDFQICQKEYADMVDHIAEFARAHANKSKPPLSEDELTEIERHCDLLKNHLSDLRRDFFADHKNVIYGAGKEMFHELDRLLKDDRIPLPIRMEAIRPMAPQLGVCSGGLLTVVKQAISSMTCSTGRLKGAAHRAKLQMMDALITDHVRAVHRYPPGEEVHIVNAYFNHIARELGVPPRKDPFIRIGKVAISPQQKADCRLKVLSKLKPSALAVVMGESVLDKLKGAAIEARIDVVNPVVDEEMTALYNVASNLKSGELNKEYGNIPEHSFLLSPADASCIVEEGDTLETIAMTHGLDCEDLAEWNGIAGGGRVPYRIEVGEKLILNPPYRIRMAQQPTLLAKHFMEDMKRNALVDFSDTIRLAKRNADTGNIMQLGDLFWLDKEGECDELDVRDLLQVSPQQICRNLVDQHIAVEAYGSVLQSVAQHVLDGWETGQIQDVPGAWLDAFGRLFKTPVATDKSWIAPVMKLAAACGRDELLRDLLMLGANADIRGTDGMSPLMYAARYGQVGALSALRDWDAELDLQDEKGMSAAMFAARHGQTATLGFLCNDGAELELRDVKNGMNAMMLTARYGHTGALDALIEAGAEVDGHDANGMDALMHAARNGQSAALEVLIAADAEVDWADMAGYTAAVHAAVMGHADALRILIRNGADIHAVTDEGFTPAILAAVNGHVDALQVLLDKEPAIINIPGPPGMTLAMYAAKCNQVGVLQVLVNRGARLDVMDTAEFTALTTAVFFNHVDALQVLLRAPEEVGLEARNGARLTPAMMAAEQGHAEVLQALIDAGAEIHERDNRGMTPAMLAAESGHAGALKVLIDADPSIFEDDKSDSYSLAQSAAMGNHAEVLRVLINADPSLIETAKSKRHALAAYAAAQGQTAVLKILLDADPSIAHARFEHGRTLAMIGVQERKPDIVQILIGTDPAVLEAADLQGNTLAILAAFQGDTDMLQILVKANPQVVHAKNIHGDTAALMAAFYGHVDALEILVAAGADIDAENQEGWSPRKISEQKNDVRLLAALRPKRRREDDDAVASEVSEAKRHRGDGEAQA